MTTATPRPHITGTPRYSATWPSRPESAGHARALVREAFNTWNLDAECLERALLVTSELVTNAITHSSRAHLRVNVTRRSPDAVRITVADGSQERPEPRRPSTEDTSGRGLWLVQTVADGWGVVDRSVGKSVYADLAITMTDNQQCCVCWAAEVPLTACGRYTDGAQKLICSLCEPLETAAGTATPRPCSRCVRLALRIASTSLQLNRLAPDGLQTPGGLSTVTSSLIDVASRLRSHLDDAHGRAPQPPAEARLHRGRVQ